MVSGLSAPPLPLSSHLSVLHPVSKYLVQLSKKIPGTDCARLMDLWVGTEGLRHSRRSLQKTPPTPIAATSYSSS